MPLNPFETFIDQLKTRVRAMLVDRTNLQQSSDTATPAPVWDEILSVYSYLLNLSPEDFKNIRFHTELINGDLIGNYWSPIPPHIPDEFAKGLGYLDLLDGLPEDYWIGEPPTPGIPRPLGVEYQGLTINRNIARYQIAIANLYQAGVLDKLAKHQTKQFVLEVGGGYGGLAHHIGRILDQKITYLLVDLPEMFLFQGPYLAVNNPHKKIYVYDRQTFTPEFIQTELSQYDFALIPNFALNQLAPISSIALMINMQSFQEMSTSQIRQYLEFGVACNTEYFYSDNADCHPHNRANLDSANQLLAEYFNLYPDPSYYDNLFKDTNWKWSRYYRKFLATPKGKAPLSNIQFFTMHHADANGHLQKLLVKDSTVEVIG